MRKSSGFRDPPRAHSSHERLRLSLSRRATSVGYAVMRGAPPSPSLLKRRRRTRNCIVRLAMACVMLTLIDLPAWAASRVSPEELAACKALSDHAAELIRAGQTVMPRARSFDAASEYSAPSGGVRASRPATFETNGGCPTPGAVASRQDEPSDPALDRHKALAAAVIFAVAFCFSGAGSELVA
jgi:hypothetical protein